MKLILRTVIIAGIPAPTQIIITGPNAGGKTVVLKTVGMLTLAVQSGFHIAAKEGTEMAVFNKMFVDIGDNQSVENALSTFSSHVKNLAQIIKDSGKSTLLLFDEIGSGTEPNEGAALAIAILEELYHKGCITIATTHYGEIKNFSKEHPDFENAAMEFEKDTLEPLYKLSIGKCGDSNALYISKKMGISDAIIERTKQYIEKKNYNYELIKVLPYLLVLVGALCGVNVFALLGSGIIFASIVGLLTNSFDIFGLIEAISGGISGMYELSLLAITIGGVVSLIKFNGGIDYVLYFITSKINSKKGAEFGIAALVSVIDLCTANNTIAIVAAGPLAKDIADKYDIDKRKTASILDIFSSCWQGIIPYGAQLLTAAGVAAISPVEIIPFLYYPGLMFICGILSITFSNVLLKNIKSNEVA